jgi:predicted nucleotidyltransferase
MKFRDSFFQLIDTEAKLKVVRFLLNHESALPAGQAGMSEREISSLVRISHMTVNRVLRDLEQWHFVSYERVGRAHVWKVNPQSYAYDVLNTIKTAVDTLPQPVEALKATILSGLPKKNLIKVILFGSVSKNDEKTDSDIDLFVLTQNKESLKSLEEALERLSIICLEKFGNRLAAYVLTEKQLQQKKDLRLLEEIEKGIQLFP